MKDRDAMNDRHAMNCQDVNAVFTDFVDGELPAAEALAVRRHLADCAACRAEVESLGAVWQALGRLDDEEPSPALAGRFHALLEAYEDGRRSAAAPGWSARAAAWIASWWPRRPMIQLALTAAALVLGLAAGSRFAPGGEIALLRHEVDALNRLVSLSLLDQDSASTRLAGVAYSRRAAADDELLARLVEVLNGDDNVNVRLAAADALASFADRPAVAAELRAALGRQSSPLVQVALVDLLLEIDGPETARAVGELYERPDLDAAVRQYIARRLGPHA